MSGTYMQALQFAKHALMHSCCSALNADRCVNSPFARLVFANLGTKLASSVYKEF